MRKAADLIQRLHAKKLFEEDEDFPGDPEEFYYYVHAGGKVRKDTKTSEKTKMTIKDKKPDKELGEALVSEAGPLGAGALPAPGGMHEDGQKALMESMHGEVKKSKPPKPNRETEAEPVEPQELWELLASNKAAIF